MIDLDTTLAALENVALYRDGWDGPGSYAADPESFRLARSFLDLVKDHPQVTRVYVMIYALGTAVLDIQGVSIAVRVEFHPDGMLAVNLDTDQEELDLDFPFDGVHMPVELQPWFPVSAHA